MLARFDRYVLGQLMVVFGFFSFVIVMIYWVNRTITLFDQLVGDGQSTRVFLEFALLIVPFILFIILPVSAFAAAVNVANRLSSESEMVILRSSGVSAFRLARPALVFGLIVCMIMVFLVNVLVPVSRTQLALREAEVSKDVTAQFFEAGRFMNPAEGVMLFISNITPSGVLERVMVSDARVPENRVIYTSEQALLLKTDTGPRLVMITGMSQQLNEDNTLSVLDFKEVAFNLSDLTEASPTVVRDLRAIPTLILLEAEPSVLAALGFSRARFLHEAHTRFSKPLTGLFTALIGFAALLVGAFSRFGFWQQVAAAVALLIVIQMSNNWSENIAQANAAAWPLLYVPVGLGLVFTLGLLLASDRVLFARFKRRKEARRIVGEGAT